MADTQKLIARLRERAATQDACGCWSLDRTAADELERLANIENATDVADPRAEYKGPKLTFDRLLRMRDFAAKQASEGAAVVKINVETLLCLIDTVQHHEYVPRSSSCQEYPCCPCEKKGDCGK